MKSIRIAFAMLFCFAALFSFQSKTADVEPASPSQLPSSLLLIDDEAFWGTSIESVVFPPSMKQLHAGAFGNNEKLKAVYIPQSVDYIGDDAFDGALELTIYGVAGSYADEWANEHGVSFVEENCWALPPQMKRHAAQWYAILLFSIAAAAVLAGVQWYRPAREGKNRNPKEFPEFYTIDYAFP